MTPPTATTDTATLGPRPAFPQPTPQPMPIPRDPQRSWDDEDRPAAWKAFGSDQ